MLLAFGPGNSNEGSAIDPFGVSKHGTCDINRIVKGKFVDGIGGCIVNSSQSLCKLGAGSHFNFLRQPPYDLSESPDLIVGILAGYQHIRSIPQRPLAAFGRSPRD
jgi:hypothetical protein